LREVLSPTNKYEECPVFVIEDAREAFTFPDVTASNGEYTVSFWIKSDAAGSISIHGSTINTGTNWLYKAVTYTATDVDLIFDFETAGTYYIYHLQLEVGNKATDWKAAPEDTTDFVVALVNLTSDSFAVDIQRVSDSVSNLSTSMQMTSDAFSVEVQNVRTGLSDEISKVRDEITSFRVESNEIKAEIKSVKESGVDKVVNTTGTFNEDGLTVDRSDSDTKTLISPDGMTVYAKDNNNAVMLEATSKGVEAKDLHATTFLKVGGRSRFENYGNNRTGCFWIGGD
jgi:hypothetical protein